MKVEALLAAYSDASTRLDAAAMVEQYDIPFLVIRDSTTEVYLSRWQIRERMQSVFDTYDRAGVVSSEFTLLNITSSGENSAVAHVRLHSTAKGGESFFVDQHMVLRFRGKQTLVAALINPRGNQWVDGLIAKANAAPRTDKMVEQEG